MTQNSQCYSNMIPVPATREDITKEWFQLVLDHNHENVTVLNVDVQDATKAGENFAALVLRAFVTGMQGGQPWRRSFILKIMPVADWAKKMMADKKVFHKEVEAYNEVIPYMISVQDSQHKLIPDVPRCYLAEMAEDLGGMIVLEDLEALGLKRIHEEEVSDLDHCKFVLRSLAKLHALGYKCEFASPTPLAERIIGLKPWLFETLRREWLPVVKTFVDTCDYILWDCPEREKWKAHMAANFASIFDKATTPDDPCKYFYHTVCHGDFWTDNMMFKYGPAGKPVGLTLTRFDDLYCGLPTRDLAYFFCMCTTGDLRGKYLATLLEYYRLELLRFLRVLGVKQITDEVLPKCKLLKMYYDTIHLGFIRAFLGIPVALIPYHLEPKPKKDPERSHRGTYTWYLPITRKHIAENKELRKRLCDLIQELVEHNVS